MVGEMETKEKPKPTPDYLMQLMNDKKLMSSLPNFCGIFNHLERLLDEGNVRQTPQNGAGNGARSFALKAKRLTVTIYSVSCIFGVRSSSLFCQTHDLYSLLVLL